MKLNYADRRNDKNIIEKKFNIIDIKKDDFIGKISLINIKKINKEFTVKRPDGSESTLLKEDYNWMTIFPENKKYCITVMYDNNWNILQWYFDIARDICKYENEIPYNEDMYLDVVLLPNGKYYILDEDDLKQALNDGLINNKEYIEAYNTTKDITKMLDNNFNEFKKFTDYCLMSLKNINNLQKRNEE